MGNPAEIKVIYINLFGKSLGINIDTVFYTWIIIGLILIISLISRKRIGIIPNKFQIVLEAIYNYFQEALEQALGEKAKKFLPLIFSLFVFVLLSNWISVIPGAKAPTKDLNTCLGLAILVLFIAHYSAIKEKGIKKYLKNYVSPYWFLLPSNIFAEFSKTLSHSFRLFGNMFAGGAIISILPMILIKVFKWLGLPFGILLMPIVNLFFGIFVGAIQALVFTVLAIAYISVLSN